MTTISKENLSTTCAVKTCINYMYSVSIYAYIHGKTLNRKYIYRERGGGVSLGTLTLRLYLYLFVLVSL